MSATQLHGVSTDVHGDIVASVIDGEGRPLFAVTVPVTDDRSAAEAEALARKVSAVFDVSAAETLREGAAVPHTPGPWRAERIKGAGDCEYRIVEVNADPADEIARIVFINEAHANAQLIASSPDMLAALVRIRDARDATAEGHEIENGPALDQCFDDWAADVASAAIRLAQGDE